MDKRKDGGPAFAHGNPVHGGSDGMSLRDYFAATAMQGMNANPDLLEVVTKGSILDGSYFERAAGKAYEQADAMLKARGHVE